MDRGALIALLTRIADAAGLPPAIFIAIAEWESGLDPDQIHDGGLGAGLFACHTEGRGAGYTIEQLKDPTLNAELSAAELGPIWKGAKAAGKSDAEAIKDLWLWGQRPDTTSPQGVQATNNAIRYTIEQAGIPLTQLVPEVTGTLETGGVPRFQERATDLPTVTGLVPPDPSDPKYQTPSDPYDPMSSKAFNYALFAADQEAYRLATTDLPSTGPDEIDYINASINLIAQQMSGEQIDIQKADLQVRKMLGTIEEAGRTYREMAQYALPEGAEFIPGGGPEGIYEKIGLGTMPATTTRMNPLATALAAMGPPAEFGPTTDTSFEAALAGAEQLRGGMGAAPVATPPSPFDAALAPAAPAPVASSVAAEPTALQPTATPPLGGGVTGPGEYIPYTEGPMPYGPEQEQMNEAMRMAKIIMAILGILGGGGGQSLTTPALATATPMPSGAFERALGGG